MKFQTLCTLAVSALFFCSCSGDGKSAFSPVDSIKQADQLKIEAWQTVMDINRLALTERNRDSLAPLLSEHMVIQCPGMGNAHIEGRQNALDAYDQYAGYAKVHEVITSEPLVQLYDGNLCAVVGYHYEFRTETVAEHKPETFIGKDMYFLVREDGRWVAAAQHYSIESTN